MKRVIVLVLTICLMFAVSVSAKKASIKVNVGAKSVYSGFGVGFFSGGENVVSLKKFLDKDNAVQFGLGWDYRGNGFIASFDYLFNMFDIIEVSPGDFIVYWGVGAQVGSGSYIDYNYYWRTGFNVGLRIPIGLSYVFETIPLDISLQIVPGIGLLDGGINFWPTG